MGFETVTSHGFHKLYFIFELCPYGIWNYLQVQLKHQAHNLNFVPMGFETNYSFGWYVYCLIWTLSLWDLKQKEVKPPTIMKDIFELCPYGIWNYIPPSSFGLPFRFETFINKYWIEHKSIWTLSLWDLKLVIIIYHIANVKIWTLSLWDLKHIAPSLALPFVWYIWTLSLWDLKHASLMPVFSLTPFELCPYGIWNKLF